MDPTAPTESKQLFSRSQASSCGDGRPREPALSEAEGSVPSASSAAVCGHNNFGFELVRIPAGWFLMGCDTGQDNEKPVHRVWVDEFLLASRQVTNSEYQRFIRDIAPSSAPPFRSEPAFSHPGQPVVGVSWHEATHYCEWLRGQTDGGADKSTERRKTPSTFRLPTEAEWERAARGGREGALYPWGDAPPQSLPDYADRCASWNTGPEPVGLGEANAYGLYKMCDNVHEWCSDWYAADYYAVSPERNPP